jgi:hypothetical protein
MANTDVAVESIRQWLASQFPSSTIDSQSIFDTETHLFRVHQQKGQHPELEVSREVLERHAPEALVRELAQSDAIERMKRDPSVRIQYFGSGIHHFETRYVRCDSTQYRIVRDDKHNVSIFDSGDKLLAKTPHHMSVLSGSIFRVQESEWCAKIRAWRGEGQ